VIDKSIASIASSNEELKVNFEAQKKVLSDIAANRGHVVAVRKTQEASLLRQKECKL
jgi:hypothetical protein